MSGKAVVGAIFGGDGVNVSPEGIISLGDSFANVSSGLDNIGSEIVQRFTVPEDTTVTLLVNLTARLFRDAATSVAGSGANYTSVVTVTRDGSDAPSIVGQDSLSVNESASGTLPADWSSTITLDGNDLVVTFNVANNSYAEGSTPNVGVNSKMTVLGSVEG